MTLEPTAVDIAKIIDEWAGAHDVLTRSGVPTGPLDVEPPVVWSLPSRILWLTQQLEQAQRLVEDLHRILDAHKSRQSQVR